MLVLSRSQRLVGYQVLDSLGDAMPQTSVAREGRHDQSWSLRLNVRATISEALRSLARRSKI